MGKPEVITNWLLSKQRTHELTIVFLLPTPESGVALCHWVALKQNGSVADWESTKYHSVPRGCVKKGLVADRGSDVALCHGMALKRKKLNDRSLTERAVSVYATGWRLRKKKWSVTDRERGVSVYFHPFGISNALHGRKERNSKGVSRVFAVSINKMRTVFGTEAQSSVLYTIGQRQVVVKLCF